MFSANLAGALLFALYDVSTWEWYHYVEWTALILISLEALRHLIFLIGSLTGADKPTASIKDSAKPLLKFEFADVAFITFNKLTTVVFTYHVIHWCWCSPLISWDLNSFLTLTGFFINLASLIGLYIIYDFFYTLFHWALHHPAIYRFVHKHHHRNSSPFRGNLDAINVHPFEFISGEYNHLFAGYLMASLLNWYGIQLNVLIFFGIFIFGGGILASFNHTRYAFAFPLGMFQVAYHDVHHHLYQYNYGQYIVFWDRIFGTFKPHPDYDSLSGKRLNSKTA